MRKLDGKPRRFGAGAFCWRRDRLATSSAAHSLVRASFMNTRSPKRPVHWKPLGISVSDSLRIAATRFPHNVLLVGRYQISNPSYCLAKKPSYGAPNYDQWVSKRCVPYTVQRATFHLIVEHRGRRVDSDRSRLTAPSATHRAAEHSVRNTSTAGCWQQEPLGSYLSERRIGLLGKEAAERCTSTRRRCWSTVRPSACTVEP
jgi:hypothetical protein